MSSRITVFLLFAIVALSLPVSVSVSAAQRVTVENATSFLDQTVSRTGIKEKDISAGTGKIANRAFQISGIAFFIVMVYAGLLWMTAQGNTERIDKARSALVAAGIGLVIVVGSYSITTFVVSRVQPGAAGSGSPAGGGQAGAGQTGEPLGCCLDRAGGNELIGIWTWRLTTEVDCRTVGTNPNDRNDVHFGPEDWEFYPGESDAQCEQRFSRK